MKLFKNICLKSLAVYAAASLLYVFLLMQFTEAKTDEAVFELLFPRLIAILVYSFFIGSSFLVFEIKTAKSLKRLLHIALTYIFTVVLMLVLRSGTNASGDAVTTRDTLILILLVTLLFAVVYTVCVLVSFFISRARAN